MLIRDQLPSICLQWRSLGGERQNSELRSAISIQIKILVKLAFWWSYWERKACACLNYLIFDVNLPWIYGRRDFISALSWRWNDCHFPDGLNHYTFIIIPWNVRCEKSPNEMRKAEWKRGVIHHTTNSPVAYLCQGMWTKEHCWELTALLGC